MKIIFPTHFSSFNVEVLLLLAMKIIFPTHFSSFNVEVLVLLVMKVIFPIHFSSSTDLDSLGGTREAPGRQERTSWTA